VVFDDGGVGAENDGVGLSGVVVDPGGGLEVGQCGDPLLGGDAAWLEFGVVEAWVLSGMCDMGVVEEEPTAGRTAGEDEGRARSGI